jgi:molybdopterin converting factor small subunit
MSLRIELYGVIRRRAGVEAVELPVSGEVLRLSDVLDQLRLRFPALADLCIDGDRLRRGYTANLNGRQFISAPETALNDGDALLLMSNDAGG